MPFARKLPVLPRIGTIIDYDLVTKVGHIDVDGAKVRFDRSTRGGEVIPLTTRVEVRTVERKLFGGLFATEIAPLNPRQKLIDSLRTLVKPHSTREMWSALLSAAGAPARATHMLQVALPAARLVPGAVSGAATSKVGGDPDLANGAEWPTAGGRPLSFVAQIRLEEAPAAVRASLHQPERGLLSFFVLRRDTEDTSGSVSGAASAATVIHTPETASYAPQKTPRGARRMPERGVALVEDLRMPGPQSPHIAMLDLSDGAKDALALALAAVEAVDSSARDRFGGHADAPHTSFEERVDASGGAGSGASTDTRLLLQIEGAARGGLSSRGSDDLEKRLLFWAKDGALARGEFGAVGCLTESS